VNHPDWPGVIARVIARNGPLTPLKLRTRGMAVAQVCLSATRAFESMEARWKSLALLTRLLYFLTLQFRPPQLAKATSLIRRSADRTCRP